MNNIKELQDAATAGKLDRILSGQDDNVHLRYLHGQIHHRLIQVISSQHKGSFNTLQEFMEQQLNNAQIVQFTQRLVVKQLKQDYLQALKNGGEIVTVPEELYKHKYKPHLTLDKAWREILEWLLISQRMGFAIRDMHDTSDASESLHSVLPKNEMGRILYSLPEQDRERKLKDILALTRGIRIFKFYLHGKPVHAHLEGTLRSIYDACRSGVVQNEIIYPLFRQLSRDFVQVEYQLMCMLLDGMIANLQHAVSADKRLLGGEVNAASKKNETSSLFALNRIENGRQHFAENQREAGAQTDVHPPNRNMKRVYYGWQKLSTDTLSNCNDDIKDAVADSLTVSKVTINPIPQVIDSTDSGQKTTSTMAIGTDESAPSSPNLSTSTATDTSAILESIVEAPVLDTVKEESKPATAASSKKSSKPATAAKSSASLSSKSQKSSKPATSQSSASNGTPAEDEDPMAAYMRSLGQEEQTEDEQPAQEEDPMAAYLASLGADDEEEQTSDGSSSKASTKPSSSKADSKELDESVQVELETAPIEVAPVAESSTVPQIAITMETSTDTQLPPEQPQEELLQSLEQATQARRKSTFKPPNDFEIPQSKQYSEWEYRAQALRLAKMQIMRHTGTQSQSTTFKRDTNDQTWLDGKQAWTQTRRDTAVGSPRFVRAKNGHVLVFQV